MRNKKPIALFMLLPVLFILSGCGKSQEISSSQIISNAATFADGSHAEIAIQNKNWCIEVARSDEKKNLGLSGREGLSPKSGMLFVFDPPDVPIFWMKDMRFNLDFVWILDNKVVDVTRNVSYPNSQVDGDNLPRYTPKTKVNFVLEVPQGDAVDIKVGDTVNYYSICVKTPSS